MEPAQSYQPGRGAKAELGASTGHTSTPQVLPPTTMTTLQLRGMLLHLCSSTGTQKPQVSQPTALLPDTRQWNVHLCPGDLTCQTAPGPDPGSLPLPPQPPRALLQSTCCSQAQLSCLLCPISSHAAFQLRTCPTHLLSLINYWKKKPLSIRKKPSVIPLVSLLALSTEVYTPLILLVLINVVE